MHVDVNGWHLYLKDITATKGLKMDQVTLQTPQKCPYLSCSANVASCHSQSAEQAVMMLLVLGEMAMSHASR